MAEYYKEKFKNLSEWVIENCQDKRNQELVELLDNEKSQRVKT